MVDLWVSLYHSNENLVIANVYIYIKFLKAHIQVNRTLKFFNQLALIYLNPYFHSNLGFAILGRVMGRIMNGTSYEDWMKRELFDKIGLRNTGFNVRQR